MYLILGDCIEKLKSLPDKSVDLFVCDLPYGCLSAARKGKRVGECEEGKPNSNIVIENKPCAWDIKLDLTAFWIQVKRLCKDDHTPVLMFCNARFGFDLYNSNPDWFRYDLVWNKMRGVSFLSANKMPMRAHEFVYVFSKKGANYYRKDIEGDFKNTISLNHKPSTKQNVYGVEDYEPKDNTGKRCVLSVVEMVGKIGKNNHPTAKPVELYKWLIERYSKKGDCVLDATFGSGNSGVASVELGRKYIGIEKDRSFFYKFINSGISFLQHIDTSACKDR